ncbi:unnamed protein product [Effrenium voratum]|nr:unnamed protein product [Effrenium voratum]
MVFNSMPAVTDSDREWRIGHDDGVDELEPLPLDTGVFDWLEDDCPRIAAILKRRYGNKGYKPPTPMAPPSSPRATSPVPAAPTAPRPASPATSPRPSDESPASSKPERQSWADMSTESEGEDEGPQSFAYSESWSSQPVASGEMAWDPLGDMKDAGVGAHDSLLSSSQDENLWGKVWNQMTGKTVEELVAEKVAEALDDLP